ncbi:MAG: hypothetical protein AVDCRST_MAG54-3603 [uncultured Actinomycetospora sp.]|uniref:Uncharacterized protein n=1 Tax=uncultured Actinomycetospora sp. TaxID=1135996 RepID=A0A6J4JKN2_9PSEU|nr:MAG: hypothetical protein AVDCRST_MAG54-3603 [uncultured Actinomycetospora sp.]
MTSSPCRRLLSVRRVISSFWRWPTSAELTLRMLTRSWRNASACSMTCSTWSPTSRRPGGDRGRPSRRRSRPAGPRGPRAAGRRPAAARSPRGRRRSELRRRSVRRADLDGRTPRQGGNERRRCSTRWRAASPPSAGEWSAIPHGEVSTPPRSDVGHLGSERPWNHRAEWRGHRRRRVA